MKPELEPIYRMTSARTNADLIVLAARLGYIDPSFDAFTLDPTYGSGRFWKKWQPSKLIKSDINNRDKLGNFLPNVIASDFTEMPWCDEAFDTVVFDPPYKLNGTPSGGGPASSDEGYGVGQKATTAGRMALIYDGLDECTRVLKPGGHLLVKCQDQVVSGRVVWQAIKFVNWVEGSGREEIRLVDMLHLPGVRKQPPGRRQVHAHSNYSTLLVFQRGA